MLNLLTKEEVGVIKKEYRLRVVVVGVMFVFVIMIFSIMSLLPSYFNAVVSHKIVEAGLRALVEESKKEGDDEVLFSLSGTTTLMRFFNSLGGVSGSAGFVEDILSVKTDDIIVDLFSFDTESEEIVLVLAGVAETRDSLINFSENIESLESVESVVLPAGDLARSRDVSFRMTIKGLF